MKRQINKVLKKRNEYEFACAQLEKRIREVCEFNARLTWCSGDGHVVLNEDTAEAAMLECLIGRTKQNKLTVQQHLRWCI